METTIGGFLVAIAVLGFLLKFITKKAREDHWNECEARLNTEQPTEAHSDFWSEQEAKMNNETSEMTDAQEGTKRIMLNALTKIGCQPTPNPDESVSVQYQGETFFMHFGGVYAVIWDPMWAGIRADDPNLPRIREAVNVANYNFGPTVVLSAPNDEGIIGFSSRRDIMLHPACPDNWIYIKAVLDSFFNAKEHFRESYQQLLGRQMESQKNRRPVGFAANQTNKTEE